MITYDQVKEAVHPTPPLDLIQLFNELEDKICGHPDCLNDLDPFAKLKDDGSFCLSATSIQSNYVAFVLGKYHKTSFPEEIIQMLFNVPTDYSLQFKEIDGRRINGCICVIHLLDEKLDLHRIYDHIYSV
ncbi:MAG TPA: hypothetical protein VJ917_10965 [Saprospiraceae bacterium]|nr:hypothetical protein [Saprospiraceae bacterium]